MYTNTYVYQDIINSMFTNVEFAETLYKLVLFAEVPRLLICLFRH